MAEENGTKRVLGVLELVKSLGGWVVAVVMVVLSAVFWIQGAGDDKYYPKLKGEQLEQQVTKLEEKLDKIDGKGDQILQLIYELRGSMDRPER